jgi:hypothetical protein
VLTDVELIELRYTGKPAAFLRGFRAVYVAGGALVALISRRRIAVAGAEGGAVTGNIERSDSDVVPTPAPASEEEMERLRRALAEVED